MLKNNKKTNLKQRFSIRKLTIGAASVLIGLIFFGSTQSIPVHAAEANNPQEITVQTTSSHQTEDEKTTAPEKPIAEKSQFIQSTDQAKRAEQLNKTTDSETVLSQALVPGKNNTVQPNKINGEGKNARLTNVPDNGSIAYDYSISAKNKNDGQTQEVTTGAAGHDNTAVLVDNNAEDIQAHLTLTNVSKKDQMIGTDSTDRYSYNCATLFINAWSAASNSLKINADKSADVVFIKNGKVITDNALPVYYQAENQGWYTYQNMIDKFGKDSIYKVRQIGFRGIIPSEITARMDVPLIVDPHAEITANEIDSLSYNDQFIDIDTYRETPKIWSISEVKDYPLHLVTRNQDGTYNLIDDAYLAQFLPKVGQVLEISYSGNPIVPNSNTLYKNGIYIIKLSDIQSIVGKFGYSVNPEAHNLQEAMPFYSYSTDGREIIYGPNGKNIQSIHDPNSYFYVEVHKIIKTKDQVFYQGSKEAQNWNVHQGVTGVYNVVEPRNVPTGYILKNVPGNVKDIRLINISTRDGKSYKTINGETPVGVYYVTVGYKLNNSNAKDMFIEDTFTVTIKPRAINPASPTSDSGEKTVTPSEEPIASSEKPVVPSPTPVSTDNKETAENPLPEVKSTENKTVEPKAETVKKTQTKVIAPKGQKVVSQKKEKTAPIKMVNKVAGTKQNTVKATAVKVVNDKVKANKKVLPQTGEKQNKMAWLGLSLVAVASALGIMIFKKKKE